MSVSRNRLVWRRVSWVVGALVAVVGLAEWVLVARVADHPVVDPASNPRADASQLQTILSHHPDALEITSSPGFQTWLHQDPVRVQVLERGVATDTVALLAAYKASITPPNPR
jgi:hypothetical protein